MNKEQFLEKYGKPNTVILCKTKELAEEFLALCEKFNIKWADGRDALSFLDLWEVYKDETCFNLNRGRFLTYGSKSWYEAWNFAIIPFEARKEKEIKNE